MRSLADDLNQRFPAEMPGGGLLKPIGPTGGMEGITAGTSDLLTAQQVKALHTSGAKAVMASDFDASDATPWAPLQIRMRLIDAADGYTIAAEEAAEAAEAASRI